MTNTVYLSQKPVKNTRDINDKFVTIDNDNNIMLLDDVFDKRTTYFIDSDYQISYNNSLFIIDTSNQDIILGFPNELIDNLMITITPHTFINKLILSSNIPINSSNEIIIETSFNVINIITHNNEYIMNDSTKKSNYMNFLNFMNDPSLQHTLGLL